MRVWNSHFFAFAETFAQEPLFDVDPGLFRRAVLKAVHRVQQTHHWSVNPFFTFCTMLHVAFSHAGARWCSLVHEKFQESEAPGSSRSRAATGTTTASSARPASPAWSG